jgi:CRP-like cAMP-binding protein
MERRKRLLTVAWFLLDDWRAARNRSGKADGMIRKRNADPTIDLLNRMEPLSFLSPPALRELASVLNSTNFKKGRIVLNERELTEGVHILLTGVAKITYLRSPSQRVTVALLAPGPLPELPILPISQQHFRCEAHRDCRIASLSWDQFDLISRAASKSDLRRFHQNSLLHWHRWSLGFLGFDIRERLIFTLLQLCSSFGIPDSRGTLLRLPISHKLLAELVGSTRPRVTEHLAQLRREHLLIRQGRQIILPVDRLRTLISVLPPSTNNSSLKLQTHPAIIRAHQRFATHRAESLPIDRLNGTAPTRARPST